MSSRPALVVPKSLNVSSKFGTFFRSRRRLLQVLAAAGNSSNLGNLPHLETRVRIAAAQGQIQQIQQELIDAVNGPLLSRLNAEGVNVSYIQLTALSVV